MKGLHGGGLRFAATLLAGTIAAALLAPAAVYAIPRAPVAWPVGTLLGWGSVRGNQRHEVSAVDRWCAERETEPSAMGARPDGTNSGNFPSASAHEGLLVSGAATQIYQPGPAEGDSFRRDAFAPMGPAGRASPILLIACDLNKDRVIDIADVALAGMRWLKTGPPCWVAEDFNADGVVDMTDIATIGTLWLAKR